MKREQKCQIRMKKNSLEKEAENSGQKLEAGALSSGGRGTEGAASGGHNDGILRPQRQTCYPK